MTKEEARQKVAELVAKYEGLRPSEIKTFHEAKTKQGFIEPLFRALGWDFDDINEVTPEERASNGRVDYAFKLNGVSQFYLEAKPLRADLTRAEYAKQAVTYAYNKGVTWAALSDFERLIVYVAQTGKPFINLAGNKYLTEFDDLWLLSKESFQKNALVEKAEKYSALPLRLGIEQRLFNQLRQWREELFNQVYHYNKHLSPNQIDEVIQRLFNRLIFIRSCEDRRIEERVLLGALHEWQAGRRKGEFVEQVRRIFSDFDGYYDSDLFAHHITDWVFIEGTTLERIMNGLYEVPGGMASYDFSIIDADILGAVYEQYLGHVAAIVKQRAKEAQARMELGLPAEETFEITAKRQRRKEQGIYYTPKFVTNYIVKETVGRFLKERSYNEIRNIKILDPACGSGSFLIRAYDELLNYHAYQRGKAVAELDQWERRPILTGNIFGVDLDMQAVEIARLNLLLGSLARRETLPSLADNIRQGNSLISGREEELKKYFGNNWRDKKPFNWEEEFKDLMAQGGFDVVIGNPPYLRVSGINEDIDRYIRTHFETVFGHFDYYIAFLERSVKLLKDGGLLGFIVPNKFLVRNYAKRFRSWLLDNATLVRLVDFSAIPVFGDASIYPVIIVLSRSAAKTETRTPLSVARMTPRTFTAFLNTGDITYSSVEQKNLGANKYCTFDISIIGNEETVFRRIERGAEPLGAFAKALTGTPAINLFYRWGELLCSQEDVAEDEKALPFINVSNVSRYAISWGKKIRAAKRRLSAPYLRFHSEYVGENKWRVFCINPKIVVAGTAKRLTVALDEVGYANLSLYAIVDWESKRPYHINYLLALINSTLLNFWFSKKFGSTHMAGGYITYNGIYLEQLPIRRIDFGKPAEKKKHDSLVALVERMLELNKRLAPMRNSGSNEETELLRQIERTDKEIDSLVYDLYGLTEEERKIVEGESPLKI